MLRVFLEEAAIKPHRSRYWLNPKVDDDDEYKAAVREVCEVYAQAETLHDEGVHVVCCDEKTSIQALARDAPTRPMRPGTEERIEYEYERHGTTCLIANLEVATGRILSPSLGPTRDEADMAVHVRRTVEAVADARWIFVMDNLTTHISESLVRLVAEKEGLDIDLGEKGKRGILKSLASRREFLSDKGRRIRFVYTPKHCSWLNQVEIWFSILVRRVLKRGSFRSVDELTAAILSFISYFNRVLAKPFRWTYTGRALAA